MNRQAHLHLATFLLTLAHQSSIAQPAPGKAPIPGPAAANGLLDARSREIRLQFKYDPDVSRASAALANSLKGSEPLKQTILVPCPPPPAPSPAGHRTGRVVKIGTKEGWETVMPAEIEKALPRAAEVGTLSDAQRKVLRDTVAPEFAKAGDNQKFTTILAPNCPGPSPAPAGHVPAKAAAPNAPVSR